MEERYQFCNLLNFEQENTLKTILNFLPHFINFSKINRFLWGLGKGGLDVIKIKVAKELLRI